MIKEVLLLQRFGQIIKIKPEMKNRYLELHRNAWPEVLSKISKCNIRNYSIFSYDEYLFAYYEYVGNDYETDMKKMADDPSTQKWWDECMPCQESLSADSTREWWLNMECVFFTP